MSDVSVVVVDDDSMVADLIAAYCERIPHVHAVATGHDGHEAITLIEDLRPDLAIVDIVMPKLNGIGVVEYVRHKGLRTRVILITGCYNEDLHRRAFAANAAAYLLKTSNVDEFRIVIDAVMRGRMYVTPELMEDFRESSIEHSIN